MAAGVAVLVLVGFAGVGLAVGATDSGATDSGAAQVRVAHLSPDAPAVDVLVDGDMVLEGGTVYSAVASGYLSPDDEPADVPFDLLVATDAGGEETMNATAPKKLA